MNRKLTKKEIEEMEKNETVENKEETYNLLDTWKIFIQDKIGGWLEVQKWENEEELHNFSGKVWLENDVLILSSWKVHDGIETTIEDWKNHLKNLPSWNKTKYFAKIADIGDSGLRYCNNGKEVNEKEAKSIIKALKEE